MNYQTVFELGDSIIDGIVPLVSFLVVGVVLFLLGAFYLVSSYRGGTPPVKKLTSAVMLIIGALWLSLSPTVLAVIEEKSTIQDLYDAGHYETVEGTVKVLREQPIDGDTVGDQIEIGGVRFTINFYIETPGYKHTIANGGALRDGVRARLRFRDGVILKVEVAN